MCIRDSVYQVLKWNFQGLRFYRGSKFPFSYWFLNGPYNRAALLRCLWFSRLLSSSHNSRSIWSRRLASRSSPTNMAASRLVEWCHFVEVNSRNIGGGHVCLGSYDGFNFAGWHGAVANRYAFSVVTVTWSCIKYKDREISKQSMPAFYLVSNLLCFYPLTTHFLNVQLYLKN